MHPPILAQQDLDVHAIAAKVLLVVLFGLFLFSLGAMIYLAKNFNRLVQSWFLKEEARRRGATLRPAKPAAAAPDEFEKPRHWFEDPNVTRPTGLGD